METNEIIPDVDLSNVPEDVKEAIGQFISKERTNSMILGFRVACRTILQDIETWREPNVSKREYERIFKRVEEFCAKALKTETVQN